MPKWIQIIHVETMEPNFNPLTGARSALSSANLNIISIDEGFWVEDLQH